jgi:hypothetical protein
MFAAEAKPIARKRVALRHRRRERLDGDDPLQITAILTESAIKVTLGDLPAWREQLETLATLIDSHKENVDIRILPFDAPATALTGAATFVLFDFDSPHLPTLAWQEAIRAIGFSDDPELVDVLRYGFEQTLEVCLDRERSLDLVRKCLRSAPARE